MLVAVFVGNGYHAFGAATCLSNDLCLLLVEFGVKHLMGDVAHAKHLRQKLGNFHGGGTYQAGAARVAHFLNLFDDGAVFLAVCLVNAIVHVVTCDRTVGGNFNHVELVDIPKLASLCACCTGHTCQLVVHAEIVLQSDGGKGLCGSFNLDVLLGLNGLV